jgi:peptidyl-dipeptidase A
MVEEFIKFVEDYETYVAEKSKELHLKYFEATISGDPDDYQKVSELEYELSRYYSDKEKYEFLLKVKESGEITEHVLSRELTLLINSFASHQFDEKLMKQIIDISTDLERKFSTYRATIGDKEYTDNEIDEILETSKDNSELETAWKASKGIGEEISDEVIEVVKLRNKAAQQLGYNNYHEMSLKLSEQTPEEILQLLDELDIMTSDGFSAIKSEMDEKLSALYNVPVEELKPWHYQDKFFQQGPKIVDLDLDKYFADKDIVELTRKYYNGIGLEIDDLLAKSDLYEKPGKYQHAYCTDIDREGDVRVLCNIKPNYKWMGTMLHEFGHAVYDKYIERKLPWELRTHAHIFATEAIAMMFGRMAASPAWLHDVAGISEEERENIKEDAQLLLKTEQLIFSRWVQVIYRFESEMYANPDQDLNSLWWELVEKYQFLKKPEGRNKPDWASKIHVALYPAYYHNYILGEILASQLYYYISTKVLDNNFPEDVSFAGKKEVGEYLKNLFFSYGAVYPWNELIEKATGEKLTPKYYALQFVGK